MAPTIKSTASLQLEAPVSSSAGSTKLPFSLRLRAGSIGRDLKAANVTSLSSTGAAALDKRRDNAVPFLVGGRDSRGDERIRGDDGAPLVVPGEDGGVSRLFLIE